ncbi:maltokinase N-terminal cap-like domain-containing protein [Agromyces bracchium]|uniref:maltokinase N-terminal cap-like domain-containing protein n=1 Tax=Agromyces bracchium TaxID=88376 RepID=UPI0018ACEACB|nr:phosphotransferase [Agromyces bracchium]
MDSALAAIAAWMPEQRWYGGKGRTPALRRIGAWELPVAEPGVRAISLLVMDDAADPPVLYQVPVVERPTDAPDGEAHLIGMLEDGTRLYDGPHDPAFTDGLLELIRSGGRAVAHGAAAMGHPAVRTPDGRRVVADAAAPATRVAASVLGGEQSNTSIVFRPDGAPPVICKVFRQLHHGDNPDVTLQTALGIAGSPHIPPVVGDVLGEWDDVGRADGRAHGHLAFAQEFLPGVEDAWRVALLSAASARDFTAEARALGVAVSEVHASLGASFGREPASPDLIAAIAAAWRRRLAIAVAEVPALEPLRDAIESFYARAEAGAWPDLQRVHGDLHLGQVILAPDRGWFLLDFEGEPMRPMAERRRPDLPVRDVAGMLRSFDYVAGATELGRPARAADARAWAASARQAFIDGYVAASGMDLTVYQDLLAAFELDKAVYEAIYETRNRPDWAPIPLRAIEHLLETGPLQASPEATDAPSAPSGAPGA